MGLGLEAEANTTKMITSFFDDHAYIKVNNERYTIRIIWDPIKSASESAVFY